TTMAAPQALQNFEPTGTFVLHLGQSRVPAPAVTPVEPVNPAGVGAAPPGCGDGCVAFMALAIMPGIMAPMPTPIPIPMPADAPLSPPDAAASRMALAAWSWTYRLISPIAP